MKHLLCAVCLLFFASCHSMSSSDNAPVNSHCLMNPSEAVDASSVTVDFEGQKVAFCCKRCARKFESLTPEQKREKIAAATR
ncbi:MAG: hypothetical protein KDB80_01480 [Planctomycetes bacterium]|nr:hypothetical protein [Planctomycetota bacterium]